MLNINTAIKELNEEKAYKFPAIQEADCIKQVTNKEAGKEFYRRIYNVLISMLSIGLWL